MVMLMQVPVAPRWKPYLGQQAAAPAPTPAPAQPAPAPAPAAEVAPAPVQAPAPSAPSGYVEDMKRRLANAGIGAAIGLLVGGVVVLVIPGAAPGRRDAGMKALFGGLMAAASTFIPFGKSRWVDSVATVGGAIAGASALHIAFPGKKG